jgi:hypothetical protein
VVYVMTIVAKPEDMATALHHRIAPALFPQIQSL